MIKLLYLNTNSSQIAAICQLCAKARRGEVARQPKPWHETCSCKYQPVYAYQYVSMCVHVYQCALTSQAALTCKSHRYLESSQHLLVEHITGNLYLLSASVCPKGNITASAEQRRRTAAQSEGSQCRRGVGGKEKNKNLIGGQKKK